MSYIIVSWSSHRLNRFMRASPQALSHSAGRETEGCVGRAGGGDSQWPPHAVAAQNNNGANARIINHFWLDHCADSTVRPLVPLWSASGLPQISESQSVWPTAGEEQRQTVAGEPGASIIELAVHGRSEVDGFAPQVVCGVPRGDPKVESSHAARTIGGKDQFQPVRSNRQVSVA